METIKETAKTTVQGTDKMAAQKPERNPSSTYTIKQMGEMIKKIEKLKMATPNELTQLKEIHKTIVTRWIGGQLGI